MANGLILPWDFYCFFCTTATGQSKVENFPKKVALKSYRVEFVALKNRQVFIKIDIVLFGYD